MKLKRNLLLGLLCLSVLCCSACSNGSQQKNEEIINPTQPTVTGDIAGGTHQVSVTPTGKYITQQKKSNYKIVISKTAGTAVQTAAADLAEFIKRASGIKLPIIKDDNLKHSADNEYLCVGKNSLSDDAGIEYNYDLLGYNGLKITTKDKSVYMGGYDENGSSNAVYEFLSHAIGFEAYGKDYIDYQTNIDIELYDFDITEVPDFQWRRSSSGSINTNRVDARRMRFNPDGEIFVMIDGLDCHNTFKYIPPETYKSDHPEWFSNDGEQLCYTAHGDKKSLEEMINVAFEKAKAEIIAQPHAELISFTQQDANTWCQCETCAAERAKYGTDAAVMIKFVNRLDDKIQAWIKDNNDGVPADRSVKTSIFAYQRTEKPPVKEETDASGNIVYVPVDESVVLNDTVHIMIAPLSADYINPLNVGQNNTYLDMFDGWSALSSQIYMWIYQANYKNYLYPYNSFNSMSVNYKLLKDKGNVYYIFNQGQYGQPRSTGFNELKIYLDSKMQWNVNVNMQTLIEKYFAFCYGDAAAEMTNYFNSMRTWLDYIHSEEHLNLGKGVYEEINRSTYFPKNVLDGWLDTIERALVAIKPYENENYEYYTELYDRITVESIFPRYALLTLYSGYFSDSELRQLRTEFAFDARQLGFEQYQENGPLTDVYTSWDI